MKWWNRSFTKWMKLYFLLFRFERHTMNNAFVLSKRSKIFIVISIKVILCIYTLPLKWKEKKKKINITQKLWCQWNDEHHKSQCVYIRVCVYMSQTTMDVFQVFLFIWLFVNDYVLWRFTFSMKIDDTSPIPYTLYHIHCFAKFFRSVHIDIQLLAAVKFSFSIFLYDFMLFSLHSLYFISRQSISILNRINCLFYIVGIFIKKLNCAGLNVICQRFSNS